jgi:SepF-like predicted cell division protein (DUF552 family)
VCDVTADNRPPSPVYITKLDLRDERDLQQIARNLAQNRILFVQTKLYFEQHRDDLITLRNTMNQLKHICQKKGGSLGRIGDDILVMTPSPQIRLY